MMGEISIHDEDEVPSGVFDAVDVSGAFKSSVNTDSDGEVAAQRQT